MNFRRLRPELVGLILAALLTRTWQVFRPDAVVFDEVYFKVFAGHYFDGHYFFDIHPPLGKLLLAGYAHLLGLSGGQLINGTAVQLRLLPAVAGALLVPVVWGILRRLGASRPFAFLGAFAVLLDGALTVESRFILVDSMLLLAGLAAFYWYLVARDSHSRWRWLWIALAAASAGTAASIKWTGLTALALVGLAWLLDFQRGALGLWRRLGEVALLILLPVAIYLGAFWLHFTLLPSSGDGDAFMSVRFQSTLSDSPYYDPSVHLSFWQKLSDLNVEMFKANQTLTATHPYGSHWYTWPIEQRPIYYWQGQTLSDGRQGNIYLLGNPIVWWGILAAAVGGLFFSLRYHHRLRPVTKAALSLMAIAYLMNFVPFMAVTRVMFLYHYFFAFFFSLIFVVLLWNDLSVAHDKPLLAQKHGRLVFGVIVAAIVVAWGFFAPITYGTPLSPQGLQARMWLTSWR